MKTLARSLVALTSCCAAAGCGGAPGHARAPAAAPGTCVVKVAQRPLPSWMTSGFTGKDPAMPYVLGHRGEIGAILFGDPLTWPPRPGRNNKILWVARTYPATGWLGDLTVTARGGGSPGPVTRTVPGGPGPSIIDLPGAGCWHLTLTWPRHTDTMDLWYAPA